MRTKAKNASYRDGIEWIAFNDEPGSDDVEEISDFISTCLLADLFGKPRTETAADILRYRKKHWQELGWRSARGN
jgi:hypothetical protein